MYWKLYLQYAFVCFSHYTEFLILYIVDKCEFYRTRALFCRVRWTVWPGSAPEVICRCEGRRSCRGDKKKRVKKCQRSHSGREELSFLDVLATWGRNVKRPVSSDPSWGPRRSDPLRTRRLLSWVLTSRLQCCHCYYLDVFRGNHSFSSFRVPFFLQIVLMNYCINYFCFFWTCSGLRFDYFSAAFAYRSQFWSQHSLFIWGTYVFFLFFFPETLLCITQTVC